MNFSAYLVLWLCLLKVSFCRIYWALVMTFLSSIILSSILSYPTLEEMIPSLALIALS